MDPTENPKNGSYSSDVSEKATTPRPPGARPKSRVTPRNEASRDGGPEKERQAVTDGRKIKTADDKKIPRRPDSRQGEYSRRHDNSQKENSSRSDSRQKEHSRRPGKMHGDNSRRPNNRHGEQHPKRPDSRHREHPRRPESRQREHPRRPDSRHSETSKRPDNTYRHQPGKRDDRRKDDPRRSESGFKEHPRQPGNNHKGPSRQPDGTYKEHPNHHMNDKSQSYQRRQEKNASKKSQASKNQSNGQRQDGWKRNFGDRSAHPRGVNWQITVHHLARMQQEEPETIVMELLRNLNSFECLLKSVQPHSKELKPLMAVLAKACNCSMSSNLTRMLASVVDTPLMNSALAGFIYKMPAEKSEHVREGFPAVLLSVLTVLLKIMERLPSHYDSVLGPLGAVEVTYSQLRDNGILNDKCEDITAKLNVLKERRDGIMERERTGARVKQTASKPAADGSGTDDDDISGDEAPDDFREYPEFPTPEEVRADTQPFLRPNLVIGPYRDLGHYLDVQYRLYREDFVAPLREGIQEYVASLQQRDGRRRRFQDIRVYNGVSIVQPNCTNQGLTHTLHFDNSSLQRVNWEFSKRLIFGSLVCLSVDGFETLIFATVANRDPKALRHGNIDVRFEGGVAAVARLEPNYVYVMVETSAFFESYRHVLKMIQGIEEGDLPFEQHIVRCDLAIGPPRYLVRPADDTPVRFDLTPLLNIPELNKLRNKREKTLADRLRRLRIGNVFRRNHGGGGEEVEDDSNDLERLSTEYPQIDRARSVPILDTDAWPSGEDLHLDESQLGAVQTALTRQFSVIQGPPGAGKTYIGLKIVKALLHNRDVWKTRGAPHPLLVVCYTNHALDQFLEGIHEFLKTGIVRAGSRSDCEDLKKFTLKEIKYMNRKSQSVPLNIHKNVGRIKHEMEEITKEIDGVRKEIRDVGSENKILQARTLENFMNRRHVSIIQQDVHTLGLPDKCSFFHAWLEVIKSPSAKEEPSSETKPVAMGNAATSGHGMARTEALGQNPELSDEEGFASDDQDEGVRYTGYYSVLSTSEEMATAKPQDLPTNKRGQSPTGNTLVASNEDSSQHQDQAKHTPEDLEDTAVKIIADQTIDATEKEATDATGYDATEVATTGNDTDHTTRVYSADVTGDGDAIGDGDVTPDGDATGDGDVTGHGDATGDGDVTPYGDATGNDPNNAIEDGDVLIEVDGEAKVAERERLGEEEYEVYNTVNQEESSNDPAGKNLPQEEMEDEDDGFQLVINWNDVQKRIKYGRTHFPPMNSDEADSVEDIWQLQRPDRWRLYNYWVLQYTNHYRQEVLNLQRKYETLSKEREELVMEEDFSVMQGATVIGMTTTAAARYRKILERVSPRIIVVEEAAEVLEAHIITTLTRGCEHLILIGDHQQLRPNPTVYKLAKDFNLDYSLFERMVKNGLHPHTLSTQHRMRPEISVLMKHIYHNLLDHESVRSYERIHGIDKNIFFIDHNKDEVHNEELLSHANDHEADYIVALCRYLIQQGYDKSRITILTTYKGQLYKLRGKMKKDFFEGVRVTVVDNFQGEENDIVLLSLVRSNREGSIGFLSISNRVCVALSRARMGFYCIGNISMLARKTEIWRNIKADMEERGCIGSHLMLRCQNHPDTEVDARSSKDFAAAPEGGCTRDCDVRLKCGHRCRLSCHPADPEHKEYKCYEDCPKKCEEGHACRKRCWADCGPCMVRVPKIIPGCGHEQMVPCGIDPKDFCCREPCEKILQCGHRCQTNCGSQCTKACREQVTKQWPCGHNVTTDCHRRPKNVQCPASCRKQLECGHHCQGTCESCRQGRLHAPCNNPCGRILVCSHQCKFPCTSDCPPCQVACQNRCFHSRCNHRCGDPCAICVEPCLWRCQHYRCTRLCGEPCNRPPCNWPCREKLRCGHRCIGLCGEPCPTKCRVCNREEVTEIHFGYEDERGARFIQLEDCGHIVEVRALDMHMTQNNIADETGTVSIQLKVCPRCKTPISRNLRYANFIKEALADIEVVKSRVRGNIHDIHRQATVVKAGIARARFLREPANRDVRQKLEDKLVAMDRLTLGEVAVIQTQFEFLKVIHDYDKMLREKKDSLTSDSRITYRRHLDKLKSILMHDRFKYKMSDQEVNDLHRELKRVHLEINQSILTNDIDRRGVTLGQQESKEIQVLQDLFRRGTFLSTDDLDEGKDILEGVRRRHPELSPLTKEQKAEIVQAIGLGKGHWYKCPNGHFYAIGECGGANQGGRCPDCGQAIGGQNHALAEGNQHAPEMDGSAYAAWSDAANLNNFNLDDLL
ncbi:NFX1-type zinc finger-containing protein 1-like [Branchiostoma floridae]|uniref:NFX1-type zinc finger-containing protein 1-like n=1 Tax=Branchiostoma floridae TaxID=7739 RepID=A0A9J7N6F9_BRAFL|nr:NFX1-type zinc finger-containing protein 1-like [Branchiostoma floridae]